MKNNVIGSYTEIATLAEDYRYCKQVIQQYSKSFYYAFSRLPDPEAHAVYAVYAFCRIADDAIDNETDKDAQIRNVQMMEEGLDVFLKEDLAHPMWRALKDVFARYPMDSQPFYDQLKGQKMDIRFRQPSTMEEVETYSYYVAGSVGWMLLPILTNSITEEVKQSAFDLGTAMQLTNILRDVGEDWRNGRIYLPEQLMKEEGYTEEKLRAGTIDDSFIRIWERMAARAEELYERFQSRIHLYSEDSRMAVLASAYVYRGILDEVRKNDYNCFTERQMVSAWKKERLCREAKHYLKKMDQTN